MPGQSEARPLSVCVLDSNPQSAAVYSEVFASSRARLMVFSKLEEALAHIQEKKIDLAIGAMRLSDEFLLEFIEGVRGRRPDAALLIMHPELGPEDIAVLNGCGVLAVSPEGTSPLAYREAIGASMRNIARISWIAKRRSEGSVGATDSLFSGAFDLEPSDIVDHTGGLRRLPDIFDESVVRDAKRITNAVSKVDSSTQLTFFEEEVRAVGKSRAAAALLYLCETEKSPERAWLLVRFLSFIPSYITKLALDRLAKTHPDSTVRTLAKKGCKTLLRKHPIIFHTERLLSKKVSSSVVNKAAESIAQCDSELAVAVLTSALAVRRPVVHDAAIRGLGMVGTESALKAIFRRLRILKLVRETAFFKNTYSPGEHLAYLEALAATLKSASGQHPEAAQEVARDLRSQDIQTRLKAIEIVGLSRTPQCCELLAKSIKSNDWRERLAALKAVANSPDPDSLDVIRGFIDDRNNTVSKCAMEALERLRLKKQIRSALGDQENRIRSSAAAALGRLGDKDSISELLPLVFDNDPDVAHEALKSLGRIADPACIPIVREFFLKCDTPELIADAAYCLGNIATDASLEALIGQAERLMRSDDFRLPLLIRAIGSIINSSAWRRNDALVERALNVFQQAGISGGDASRLEIAGILLHIDGLSLKSYSTMMTLLQKFAMMRSASNPKQSRMVSISRKALERIHKRILRLREVQKTFNKVQQVLESLPARPNGEKHRSFAVLGSLLSSLPHSERDTSTVANRAIDALVETLSNPNTPWRDRDAAIRALSALGERRALPALREIEKTGPPLQKELAKQVMRSIIRKNLLMRALRRTPENRIPHQTKVVSQASSQAHKRHAPSATSPVASRAAHSSVA